MTVDSRRTMWAMALLGAMAAAACGGGSGSATGPNPPGGGGATPPPTAPTPAPTPDPRLGLSAGPVTRYTVKVRTVNNGERDAEQDASGFFIVHPGERVDFDSTQKNAGG